MSIANSLDESLKKNRSFRMDFHFCHEHSRTVRLGGLHIFVLNVVAVKVSRCSIYLGLYSSNLYFIVKYLLKNI